jgi:hypothetical protein
MITGPFRRPAPIAARPRGPAPQTSRCEGATGPAANVCATRSRPREPAPQRPCGRREGPAQPPPARDHQRRKHPACESATMARTRGPAQPARPPVTASAATARPRVPHAATTRPRRPAQQTSRLRRRYHGPAVRARAANIPLAKAPPWPATRTRAALAHPRRPAPRGPLAKALPRPDREPPRSRRPPKDVLPFHPSLPY